MSAAVRSTYLKLATQQVRPGERRPSLSSISLIAANFWRERCVVSQAGADELQMLSGLGSDDTVDLLQILNSSPQELAR